VLILKRFSRRLWRNDKHPSHVMDKKNPPENHITVTQTGHLIDELLFDLEVPYILTWQVIKNLYF
jgi:hypothetical protein